jgi:tetratricopeptide (TPR) repeat protein
MTVRSKIKRRPERNQALVGLTLAAVVAIATRTEAQPRPGLSGSPGPSGSSAVSTEAHDQAAKLNEEAQSLYRKGEYRSAIKKLEQARELDPDAKDLNYNLGLVYEKLAELDPAITAFKKVLSLETDSKEREKVQGIIRRLEGAKRDLQAREGVPSAEPPPTTAPTSTARPDATSTSTSAPKTKPPKKGKLDGWVYGAAGVSLVGVGLGTFLGVRALTNSPSSPRTGRGTTIDDLQRNANDAHLTANFADAAFGVALVAGGLATYLYFSRDAEPVKVGLAPTRGGGAGAVEVMF